MRSSLSELDVAMKLTKQTQNRALYTGGCYDPSSESVKLLNRQQRLVLPGVTLLKA